MPDNFIIGPAKTNEMSVFDLSEKSISSTEVTEDAMKFLYRRVKEMDAEQELSASEALFGFAGWLTSLKEPVIAGYNYDAGVFVDLVGKFCEAHQLTEPRDGWENKLNYPDEIEFWRMGE